MSGALGQSSFETLDYEVFRVLVLVPVNGGCIDDVVDVAFPRAVGVAAQEAAKASRVWKIWVLESVVTVSGGYYIYICVFFRLGEGGDFFGIWADGGWAR